MSYTPHFQPGFGIGTSRDLRDHHKLRHLSALFPDGESITIEGLDDLRPKDPNAEELAHRFNNIARAKDLNDQERKDAVLRAIADSGFSFRREEWEERRAAARTEQSLVLVSSPNSAVS